MVDEEKTSQSYADSTREQSEVDESVALTVNHPSTLSPFKASETPTPARSRAFFVEQDSLIAQQVSPMRTQPSWKPTERPKSRWSKVSVDAVCSYVLSIESVYDVDFSKLFIDLHHITSEFQSSHEPIFTVVQSVLNECIEIMEACLADDANSVSSTTVVQDDPMSHFLDPFLHLFFVVSITSGVWDFSTDQKKTIESATWKMSIIMTPFQIYLGAYMKNKQKSSPAEASNVYMTSFVDTVARLGLWTIRLFRDNIRVSSSILRDASVTKVFENPCVEYVIHMADIVSKATLATCVNVDLENLPMSTLDATVAYGRTFGMLVSCAPLHNLVNSSELCFAIQSARNLYVALKESSTHQHMDWMLLCLRTSMKGNKIPEASGAFCGDDCLWDLAADPIMNSRPEPSLMDSIASCINDLFQYLSTFYQSAGILLAGGYDDTRIQKELATISTLGSYISLVGFLFYKDIERISRWMLPYLPNLRRRLRKPLEGIALKKKPSPSSPVAASVTIKAGPPLPLVEPFLLHLQDPNKCNLARQNESDALLSLFLPHHTKSTSQNGVHRDTLSAPAMRINYLLGWLVWESNMLYVYRDIALAHNHGNPLTDVLVENVLYDAILRGFRVVKSKFSSAFPTFFDTTGQSDQEIHEGNLALDLCHRMLECLTLCHLGEVDLKATPKMIFNSAFQLPIHGAPTLRSCIATFIGARVFIQDPGNTSTKVTEALPKVVWGLLHQFLFYWNRFIHSSLFPHNFKVSLDYDAFHQRVQSQLVYMQSHICELEQIAKEAELKMREQEARILCSQTLLDTIRLHLTLNQDTESSTEKQFTTTPFLSQTLPNRSHPVVLTHQDTPHLPHTSVDFNVDQDNREEHQIKSEGHPNDPQRVTPSTNMSPDPTDGESQGSHVDADKSPQHQNQLCAQCAQTCPSPMPNFKDIDQLRQDVRTCQKMVNVTQETLANDLIERAKQELSTYLTQTLSQTIQNHVALCLEKQQGLASQRRRARFLPWVSPRTGVCKNNIRLMANGLGEDYGSLGPLSSTGSVHENGVYSVSTEYGQLQKGDQTTSETDTWRGFDVDADTTTVMQEHKEYESKNPLKTSWLNSTTRLLEMPNPVNSTAATHEIASVKQSNRSSF